jgi:2-oxoglutarate/2-oxoacid ferredoxin oxidoreductase subunit beta
MNVATPPEKLLPKDYASDQEIRWCPGCGDYAILKSMTKVLADIGADPAKTVFVSGIGCAARFPYYIASYGFHTIHGRSPAIATGVKLANPELDIWVIGGDGDMLSIGGNHTMHALRRNVNLNILLFNNAIYGLTKGQYSPTSRVGTRSPSTPQGSVDRPVSATQFALGAGGRFVARSVDVQKDLPEVLKRAYQHKGASFVEIYQNCIVYNDGAYADFTEKEVAADTQLHLEHGQPMIFGKARDQGIRIRPGSLDLEVVHLGADGVGEKDLLVHDETNRHVAFMLAQMEPPKFPMAMGVLYCNPAPSYESAVMAQIEDAKKRLPAADINALLRRGTTWTVSA